MLFLLASCNDVPKSNKINLVSGEYQLEFQVGETEIPVRLSIDPAGNWVVHNWTENIQLDSLKKQGNIFHVDMPLFHTSLDGEITSDSTFKGVWTDHSRDSLYQINFTAHHLPGHSLKVLNTTTDTLTYDVIFSPESEEDKSRAVGKFFKTGDAIVGTFLTESGDYRFLEGTHTGESLELSAFDGTHLFYFCANVRGNNLEDGHFYSGKHWKEDWLATMDQHAMLRDPDSLTFVKEETVPFAFHVKNNKGDSVGFDSTSFANRVTVVQIFGSWCPNCTDESVFIKQLYENYHEVGLEVIPVAFERSADFSIAIPPVIKQFEELGLVYPVYYGGKKGEASDVFPMLSKIISYPTMVIVDKKGKVRKIHTGFYGPGTGEHYTTHCKMLTDFIQALLAEEVL